jgi:hypothetical protein
MVAVEELGENKWKNVIYAAKLFSKNVTQCKSRWAIICARNVNKGTWTDEVNKFWYGVNSVVIIGEQDDQKLTELVRAHGAKKWTFIANLMQNKIGKQCRERWHNHLNPDINKSSWSEEEDR